MRCSHADHAPVILMMIDVVMHGPGQGRATWRTTRFLPIKLFCQSFCISTCLDYDHLEHYGANAQNTYRRIHKSYCLRPMHTKRCYWAVILERTESRTLESHECIECLVCLVCLVCQVRQCLSWKRTLVVKSKIWNLKPNFIYSMQSIEQHYYRETEEKTLMNANCLWRKTPFWIHLMPGNVATITERIELISRSERWILCLCSL